MIIDTHAHYDDEQFDEDRGEILGKMQDAGIGMIMDAGSTILSWDKIVKLTEEYPFVYGAIGVHPDEVGNLDETQFARMERLLDKEKIKAVGEIGLDYYYDTHPKELQRFWFRQQLRLAEETNLPVIIHSRDASQETFDIIKASSVRRGSIHCYSGSAEDAEWLAAQGLYFGFGVIISISRDRKFQYADVMTGNQHRIQFLIQRSCPHLRNRCSCIFAKHLAAYLNRRTRQQRNAAVYTVFQPQHLHAGHRRS